MQTNMTTMLKNLIEVGRLNEGDYDDIIKQFNKFLDEHANIAEFCTFDKFTNRIDGLLHQKMSADKRLCKLGNECKLVLILSPGQA